MRPLSNLVTTGRGIGLGVQRELLSIQRSARRLLAGGGSWLFHDGLRLRWGHCVQPGMGDLCVVTRAVCSIGTQ